MIYTIKYFWEVQKYTTGTQIAIDGLPKSVSKFSYGLNCRMTIMETKLVSNWIEYLTFLYCNYWVAYKSFFSNTWERTDKVAIDR